MTGALWGKSTLERAEEIVSGKSFRASCEEECGFQSVAMERHWTVLGIEVTSFGILKLTKNKQKSLNIHSGGLIKGNKRASKRKN